MTPARPILCGVALAAALTGWAATAQIATPAATDESFAGLTADFYGFKLGGDQPAPTGPGKFALGRFIDEAPPSFRLDAFTAVADLAPLGETEEVGLAWRGVLVARAPGEHVFGLELSAPERGYRDCVFSATLDSAPLLALSGLPLNVHNAVGGRHTDFVSLALEPGQHPLEVWLSCARIQGDWGLPALSAVEGKLLWREPGAPVIKPVDEAAFRYLD